MKVLFIGGTGIISAAVSELCIKKGIDLYLFNRGLNTEFINKNAKLIQGDISNREEMKSLLKDETFDVVVDWLAFTPEDIKFDVELFKNKTKQFVFISSASVYQKPLSNYLVTEKTPISNPYWKYARNKIACEELLINEYNKEGFPVTIVRPSFTYGETLIPATITNNKKPMTLINRIKTGKKIIVHGDGSSLWVMTHNSDFAKGFVGLLGNEKTIGEIFHITSDEVLTWNQIFMTIGKILEVEPNIIHIPSDFINTYAPQIGEGLLGDKATSIVFDNSKIKSFVPEFNCTVKYEEGIRKSLNWLEVHPKYCEIDDENNQIIDMIIAKYETAFEQ
ncbi:MAG: SDR family oxidoreductase [Bacteroidetes bacterium]|nr:SDR family oxidoreductase [Bacteroidota bacterium]MBU1113564.1 SDR family oxidoreductase [Bacteroidota bacterium]MBU1798634.1 SDR family oxidoreductase [Bacteroidota bacterium]